MLKHFDRERLIWNCSLSPDERLILLALNSFVDGNGECWPSQETLASMTGYKDRTIRKTLAELTEKSIIQKWARRSSAGGRTTNKYRINFDQLREFQLPAKSAGNEHAAKSAAGYRQNLPEVPAQNDGWLPAKSAVTVPAKSADDLSNKELSSKNILTELSRGNAQVVSELVQIPRQSSIRTSAQRCTDAWTQEPDPWGQFPKFDQRFLEYLKTKYLPTVPSYQKVDITIQHAQKWLNGARYSQQRHDDAAIQWEAHQALGAATDPDTQRAIATELRRTGRPGVLPAEWQLSCAVKLASDLPPDKAAEYLRYLQSVPSVVNG